MADPAAVVREFWEAWNARDIERIVALLGRDAELLPMRAQLEGKTYRGADSVRQMVAEVDEDWDQLRGTVGDLRARGEDVYCPLRLQGRGRASGIDLDVPTGWHFVIRDGLIVSGRAYSDPDAALRAAGFS